MMKPSIMPAIEGRVPTAWLLEHGHQLTREEFYDQSLTEDDLKKRLADRLKEPDGLPQVSPGS